MAEAKATVPMKLYFLLNSLALMEMVGMRKAFHVQTHWSLLVNKLLF
jgi:hypothetical protein